MLIVTLLSDEEASAEARAVFDEIRAARGTGYVNNFWRAPAHDPAAFRGTWDRLHEVMASDGLDPLVKALLFSPSRSPKAAAIASIATWRRRAPRA